MFENLKEVCNYKRDGNCCYGYVCAYDENNPDLCSEEHCPFMDVINRPHKFDAKVALDACSERAEKKTTLEYRPYNGPSLKAFEAEILSKSQKETVKYEITQYEGPIGIRNVVHYRCPRCGCTIGVRTFDNKPVKLTAIRDKNYCSICGQRLHWEVK